MLHGVPLSTSMRLAYRLVPCASNRVILAPAARYMPGFRCGVLRNVAPQLLDQFSCLIGVNPRIVASRETETYSSHPVLGGRLPIASGVAAATRPLFQRATGPPG
jgi:hypothetical protein